MQHMVFYRRTVARLIETGKLPFEATELFDETFTSPFLKPWLLNPAKAA
jgi:hypothetical protein